MVENEQAEDARIAEAFAQIKPPEDLKATILAGMRAHAGNSESDAESDDTVVAFEPEPAQRQHKPRPIIPAWAGIAAALAFLFAVVIQQQKTPNLHDGHSVATAGAPDVIHFLADEINSFGFFDFDKRNKELGTLTTHLAKAGTPTPSAIPGSFKQLPTLGCVTFNYKDAKLSMICFDGDQVYHLITAERSSIGCDCPSEPQIFEAGGQSFKLWGDGDKAYIIAVEGPQQNLPEFI